MEAYCFWYWLEVRWRKKQKSLWARYLENRNINQVEIRHVGCKYKEDEPYRFLGQFKVTQGWERPNSRKGVIMIFGECNILSSSIQACSLYIWWGRTPLLIVLGQGHSNTIQDKFQIPSTVGCLCACMITRQYKGWWRCSLVGVSTGKRGSTDCVLVKFQRNLMLTEVKIWKVLKCSSYNSYRIMESWSLSLMTHAEWGVVMHSISNVFCRSFMAILWQTSMFLQYTSHEGIHTFQSQLRPPESQFLVLPLYDMRHSASVISCFLVEFRVNTHCVPLGNPLGSLLCLE